MVYILCLDIGKTKTLAAIIDDNGNLFGKVRAGPAGLYLREDVVVENLLEAIKKCLLTSNITLRDLNLISISWADLDTQKDWRKAWRIIEKAKLTKNKVLIEHDAVAAYYAVTLGKPGVAVIAGTGSIAYGMNSKGEKARVGGWGWLIDNEGGACWIAIKALNLVLRAYDGRGEKTILTEKVKNYFRIRNELEILDKVYKELRGDVMRLSEFAKIVDEAANMGDKVAIKILKEGGKELGFMALSIIEKLNMYDEENIIVGGVGSVFNSKIIKSEFMKTVKEKVTTVTFCEPLIDYQPLLGPIVIGCRKLGISLPNIAKLKEQLRNK
jgi:N-acetylglucosamine kinase-like BadF-type ATPase